MGKVIVSNGKEKLEIDGGDLGAAVKDGYKPLERVVVANSKTNESYEVDPDDVESALNEGFTYADIVKKNASPEASLPPQKDLLTLSRERKELQGRIEQLNKPTNIAAPGGYVPKPAGGEGYKKQLEETNAAIKAQGGDDQLADDIADIPSGEGFSFVKDVPALMELRSKNKIAYNQELASIKSKGNLYNAIRDKSGVKNANELISSLQNIEKSNFRDATKEGIALVRKYVDDSEDQQKIIKNWVASKAYDYGVQPVGNDERFANLNPYQQRAMHFLEDVDPATFQAYQRMTSVNPDDQWMGSQEADIRRGFEAKSKELENIGMNLQMNAYEQRLTDLNNKAESGQPLNDQEKAQYAQLASEYQMLAEDKQNQSQRYPSVAAMDADRLMQESLGGRNSVAKKFALGVGENFDDAVNWIGDLIQDRGINGDLELLGDKEMSSLNRYTTEKDKIIGSDFVAKFDPELQKQIDDVKNSSLSDEKKQDRVRELIINNQDKVSTVANDKSGKYNFTAKSVMNVVGDVASDLISQLAIGAMTGGGGNASKVKNLTSLFGSTFATAYNDYYNDALKQNIQNPTQYAIVHTTIEAASELINDDFELAKKLTGKSTTLGKVLGKVTQEEWDNIAKKGFFTKLKDAAIQTGKDALGNALQESKEEVAGQIAGNIADQKVFNKETGIGEGVKDTFIQTMIGMAGLGVFSLPFNYHNINRTQKYAMYEAGMNPSIFIDDIDKKLAEGSITAAQAEEQKENIQKLSKAIQSSQAVRTDGEQMTDNEKVDYAFNQTVISEINEQKKYAPPEAKEKLEKEEEKLNKEQDELLKPKKQKQTEEQKIVNSAIKSGKISGIIAEQAKSDPNAFLKMVADQAFGRTDTGEMSTEPNAEYAVREQYGDKIVDKAKKLFPLTEKTEQNAQAIRSNQGQIQETGNVNEGGQNQGSENLQSSKIKESINAETEQQTRDEERWVNSTRNPEISKELRRLGYERIDIQKMTPDYAEQLVNDQLPRAKNDRYSSDVIINTPEDFERELIKIFADEGDKTAVSEGSKMVEETQPETGSEVSGSSVLPNAQRHVENKTSQPTKEKKTKPALNESQQEMADYAYKNSFIFFKKKYPKIDVDEYNRLRSVKKQQGLPKLGDINSENNKRDLTEDKTQYTPESIIQKAREFYKNDPLINRVLDFLEPIIKANKNIKIDTGFDWSEGEYEGQKITNQALGYSFPSGNLILNFDRIKDYDTLYRTALHELVHAATRNEIETNKAFNEDLKKVLAEVRKAMKLPEGDSFTDTLIRNGIISKDYDNLYGASNEHELLAEVFTNEKFSEFLKGLEYKGDNMLHRLFLQIAKFFSEKYKQLVGAKKNITVDNVADYLMSLTESVIKGQQEQITGGDALPVIRPKEKEVLKNVVLKGRQIGLSEQTISDKLKQIGNLDDQEVADLLEESKTPEAPRQSERPLTAEEVGETPKGPKRKGKLRQLKEKYFDRAKGFPDWILALKDQAKGGVHLEVRQALQLVDQVRKTAKRLEFDDWNLFDRALRGQYYGSELTDLKELPLELQVLNVQMRNKIDSLSRDLIINNYVTPEQALNIESNIGEYMTRSYRAFNEKDWGKKVPQAARDEAYRLLVQEHFDRSEPADPDDPLADEQERIDRAKETAFNELQSIIDGISDKYAPSKTNIEKGKDLGILKRRLDIPKEIREVLGEYTDPGVNFAMTIARIAQLKSTAEYLTKVREQGMGEIFWEEDERPPEASVQIASEGSETWNPLNGLYTTPEIKEIFKDTQEVRNKWVQRWLKAVGAIKWSKTVGSVVTQIKNFESNLGFAIMNGHYHAGSAGQSFKFLKDKLFGGEKSKDALIEKVIKLGLVDQSVGVRELKDMFDTDNLDKILFDQSLQEKSPIKRIGNTIAKPVTYLNKVYAASDDFWKVYGFLNEAQELAKVTYGTDYKSLNEDQRSSVDVEAAERVKNTYPTYDRVWEGAKTLSKGLPIFGNFLSFQAESIRVLLNTVNYAIKDLKTDGRKAMGAKRLAGMVSYLSARKLILYTIAQMTGVGMAGLLGIGNDDDEDQKLKDINRYSPDFIRSGDKLALDHGGGKYTVYDVGSLEPYGIWFKTMNAYTEGNDLVKEGGLWASASELLSPFVEPEMSFKIGMDLYKNENDFGSRIWNPLDNKGDQVLDAMGYVLNKAKPSTIDFIQRVYTREDKKNELSAAFGGRGYEVDVSKNFSFKLKAAEELFDANRDALNKIKYGSGYTEEDIKDAEIKFEERTNKIIKMLSEDYHAAIRLGASIENLDELIGRKKFFQGYNKNVKNQIKSGVIDKESSSDEIKEWK